MADRESLFVFSIFTLVISLTQGSLVQFIAAPPEVKQGLTSKVTLHCRVATFATSGAVIGKRDVSQSGDDVAEVTSLVIMKDGKNIATVSYTNSAHLMTSDNNVLVSGSVQRNAAELGYLQVTFTDPLAAQTGGYKCEVNAISHSGHVFTSSANLQVTSTTPTITDLVTYVREMNREKEKMQQTIADLQHKLDTRVFFSAALTKQVTLPVNTTLVFDKILMNVGDGYSNSTGNFTCPIAGFYLFEMHALSAYSAQFGLSLRHNGHSVLELFGPGRSSHQGASQSTVLKLEKGDIVTLRSYVLSVLYGTATDIGLHTTFTGLLVGLP